MNFDETDGLTLAQAQKRLPWWSPSTLNRKQGKGLDPVPGSRPKLVTKASVEALRRAQLEEWGLAIEPQTAENGTPSAESERLREEYENLRDENEQLRNVVQHLRIAIAELSDAVGEMTRPSIPNN